MTQASQSRVGCLLAALVLAAWLCLHIGGVFFHDAGQVGPTLLLIVAQTWLSVGLYIVAHDAIHGSLTPAWPRFGRAVGTLAVWLYAGFAFGRIAAMHQEHHRQPGTAHDPDFAPESPDRLLPWYGRFIRTYFGPRQIALMCLRVGIYLLLGAQLLNIVLFFALPGLLSSFQLFYFGTYLPHRHAPGKYPGGFADHHRARSNEYGYLASLLSCFHFGYHHEHHLHPEVPWWRLPLTRQA